MNKQWIEAFICVANTQNVSKAAEILFLTQPTVTNRIQVLENELGEQLFVRARRKMLLTDAGRVFLPHALDILDHWNSGIESIQQLRGKVEGQLTVGIFYNALPRFTPLIISFTREFPNIRLSVKTGHSEEIGALILNHLAQVGIARTLKNDLLLSDTIMNDDYILVVYPEHPLIGRNLIEPERLREEKLVFLYSGELDREFIDHVIDGKNIEPPFFMETDSAELCKHVVMEKTGIAFLPRSSIQRELENGTLVALDSLHLSNSFSRNIEMIRLKKNTDQHITDLFVKHIHAEVKKQD